MEQSEAFERKKEEMWRMSRRVEIDGGEVVEYHQSFGMKETSVIRKYVLQQEATGVSSGEV